MLVTSSEYILVQPMKYLRIHFNISDDKANKNL